MSAAAAATLPSAAPKKGKKKLLIIVAAAVLLLGGGGGGAAVWMMKKKAAEAAAAAEAEDGEDGAAARPQKAAHDTKVPPAFLPLEPFVVNLADREVDRFAQVGITLELDEAKSGEQLKLYMPAIRNGILMILAHKSSAELQERAGKEKLAAEIARAVVRPMGIDIPDEAEASASAADKPRRKKRAEAVATPVRAVHFSSFIIQ